MLGNLIKLVIVFALLALLVTVAPVVLTWLTDALEWIIAQGKWAVIAVWACVIAAFFDV